MKSPFATCILGICLAAASSAAPVIVLPDAPTAVERTAAAELADGLRRVTGLDVPCHAEGDTPADTPRLYIGATKAAATALGSVRWQPDEICLQPVPDGLVLAGEPTRGPIYAVDTLLEDHFGVHWWTSTEATYPHATFSLPEKATRFAPPLRYRETYYRDGFDPDFKLRMKGNFTSKTRYMLSGIRRIPADKGGDHWLHFYPGRHSCYHSFFEVLPPDTYFKDHPDWYSLVDGVRQPRQLCVTNPEMAKEYIRRTKELLRDDPEADFIQVSQNDWYGACACDRCKAAEAADGGTPAGPYLAFANTVAEALEKDFPNVTVDTFAYQFTRKAPTQTRPRKNVVIRLCDIECLFSSPLAASAHQRNAAFVKDLADWQKVAPGQLLVWDYITNFSGYFVPHPNLFNLADNIRLFVKNGASGVYEQGDALSNAGDFAPLRHWLVAKLLWNPNADANALIREFLDGYYGPAAAPHLMDYLRLINDGPAKTGEFIGCYHTNVTPWLSAADAFDARAAMVRAGAAAQGNADFARRIRREALTIDYVFILNWDAYRDFAERTHRTWPLGSNRNRVIARWFADCRSLGIDAHRETTDGKLFANHIRKLLGAESGELDVRRFGAVGNGIAKDTAALQSALDTCGNLGGGTVVVPPGTYLTGTLWLRSHVNLRLEHGAVLLGSPILADYNAPDAYPQNWGSKNEGWSAKHLLIAHEVEDVALTGSGVIDGNAPAFFDTKPAFVGKISWRDGGINAKDRANCGRPGQELVFIESKDIAIRDVTLRNMCCWTCFFHGCERVKVRGVTVTNDLRHLNTDGFDIDSCRDVVISDCLITTGDDAFAVRGDPTKLKDKTRTCENILIDNCVCRNSASTVRIGVGSGAIRHVRVRGLTISHAGRALHVQCAYGLKSPGVSIEDVAFSDITIREAGEAIRVTGGQPQSMATLKGIAFTNIRAESYGPLVIEGKGQTRATDIRLSNVDVTFVKGPNGLATDGESHPGQADARAAIRVESADDVRFENCRFTRTPEAAQLYTTPFAQFDATGVSGYQGTDR